MSERNVHRPDSAGLPPDIDPRAVIEAAAESILITDASLEPPGPTIVYVNPAFERMTGWPASDIVGRSPRVLQGPDTDKSVFNNMREVLGRGDTWEGLTFNYRRDGTRFVMEWSITPLGDHAGMVTHYVSVQRDVTRRVDAEHRAVEALTAASEADRRRANLARYFSPKTVDLLANKAEPLRQVRQQDVAVLFADIVGFTSLAETFTPEQVIKLLQSYYRRMEAVVFAHGGAVEKFAGDALMATFGVPEITRNDAANALACAFGMFEELGRWNRKRVIEDRSPVRIGIGLHRGPAVFGDIGSARSLAFTVVGDTVNIASRLQAMSRSLDASLVVSQELVDRVPAGNTHCKRLVDAGVRPVRGRTTPVGVWTWRDLA